MQLTAALFGALGSPTSLSSDRDDLPQSIYDTSLHCSSIFLKLARLCPSLERI
ncbi:hypothetical protein HDU93_001101, partial [Gonapodya sp. JEL0774]